MSSGLRDTRAVANLLNALTYVERSTKDGTPLFDLEELDEPELIPPVVEKEISRQTHQRYNYVYNLNHWKTKQGKFLSDATKRAYYMWLCQFLHFMAGSNYVPVHERENFLSDVDLHTLVSSLKVARVKSWFGVLLSEGIRDLTVAKATVITLADTLARDGFLSIEQAHMLRQIDISNTPPTFYERRRLSEGELKHLVKDVSSNLNTNRKIRNAVIVHLALIARPNDVIEAKWSQIVVIDQGLYFKKSRGKNEKLPQSFNAIFQKWENAVSESQMTDIEKTSPIIRRVTKHDKITEYGIVSRSASKIIADVCQQAGLGEVSTDDIRMSYDEIRKNIDDIF